jgi:hypothetical protein
VLGGEGGGRLGGELVELHSGDSRVHAGDDLLRDFDLRRKGGSGKRLGERREAMAVCRREMMDWGEKTRRRRDCKITAVSFVT